MGDGGERVQRCWCGDGPLEPFSAEYVRCARCETLVTRGALPAPFVQDERADLYGLSYFVELARERGQPDLYTRSRADLSERCAHWLRALLRRRPPPARVLEIGCANGAFMGLLAEAGYQATGLDLSPTVTRHVADAFGVPVLTGTLEAQRLPAGSVDVVAMMDVVEHLTDPPGTLAEVARVLADDGLVVVQMPEYPAGATYQELVARQHPFLQMLLPKEHLFLLSQGAARTLLAGAGLVHLEFERAIFDFYDQFLVASRSPLPLRDDGHEALERSRGGRVVEALLDAYERAGRLDALLLERQHRLDDVEGDRAARLEVIQRQQHRLDDVEGDRAARLEVILQQQRRIDELERDLAAHREAAQALGHGRDALEAAHRSLQQDLALLQSAVVEHEAAWRRLGPLRRLLGRGRRETKP